MHYEAKKEVVKLMEETVFSLTHELFMSKHHARTLNEKVGFKIPTMRYRKNSILCGALHIGTAKWTSGVRWSFGALG